jgi:pyrroline-5-carboxylate reductase
MDGVTRLAIIGGGRMGEAIAAGLVRSGVLTAGSIVISEPDPSKRDRLTNDHGVTCVASGAEALAGADVVILAVKPQIIDAVLTDLAPHLGDKLAVSIAGGVTCARIESRLAADTRVVRVMPNTPALVGAGMSIVSGGSEATEIDIAIVEELFAAVGDVVVLPEGLQDACTAISGCGPAYMALFIDALARAGVREGLSRDLAERLALQTMAGTVELIRTTGQHPGQIIDAVSSPGGSTIEAVTELEARGVRAAIAGAVRAAVVRSQELGR